jgi:ABC-type amino acid transport substrate-binding protein
MKMKKLVSVMLAGFLAASLFGGCGKTNLTNADLHILDESLADELYGIATAKDNTALRDMIQIALDECIADGTAGEIATEWFGSDTIYVPETKTVEADPNASFDKDTVVLGCDVNFAPMGFKDGDEVVGFDIDLAKAVIEGKMGKKLQIQPITWSNKEAELSTGKVDVLWNGLTITDERLEAMSFTEAYMENVQAIVVPKDSDIKSAADLNGKKIAMQKESSAVDAYNASGIDAETVELADNVACLNELKTGRVDAIVMDSVVANYYLTKGE